MTLSGLGGVQEFGCATSRRVQTKAVTRAVCLEKRLRATRRSPADMGYRTGPNEGEIRLPGQSQPPAGHHAVVDAGLGDGVPHRRVRQRTCSRRWVERMPVVAWRIDGSYALPVIPGDFTKGSNCIGSDLLHCRGLAPPPPRRPSDAPVLFNSLALASHSIRILSISDDFRPVPASL